MLAVPYVRTSEDDKDQRPERQVMVIDGWGPANNVQLTEPIIDEGTSGSKISPFDRPEFQRAIRVAQAHGAKAIVVESIERLTREGPEQWYRTIIRLKDEYGLQVWWADMPLAHQEGMAGQIILSVRAGMAQEWVKRHSEAVKSGMRLAKKAGGRMGRPPKPIPPHEVEYAVKLRAQDMGWDRISMEINKLRGVHEIASPAVQKAKKTSGPSVRRAVLALQKQEPTKPESNNEVAATQ